MKSALSLTWIASLVGASALPVAAQDRIESRTGPIARAVTREASRLGSAAQQKEPADRNWSSVRKLQPGADVVMTVKGSPPSKRYFLLADEFGLTVLNLTDVTLPAAARDVLLGLASHKPERFGEAQKGGTFVLDKNVRLVSGDVFVADQRIASLGQLVERTARTDVVEVAIPKHHRNTRATVAVGVGAVLLVIGAIAGVLAIVYRGT